MKYIKNLQGLKKETKENMEAIVNLDKETILLKLQRDMEEYGLLVYSSKANIGHLQGIVAKFRGE